MLLVLQSLWGCMPKIIVVRVVHKILLLCFSVTLCEQPQCSVIVMSCVLLQVLEG